MTFLDEIIPEIRRSIADPRYARGVPERAPFAPASLRRALELARDDGGLVIEYKRVSPGQREPVLPFRPIAEFVESTRRSATAYSCLATPPRFHGSPSDVSELARSTDRPVLFKDIVVDPRQVDVAFRTGASAVLLIARLESEGRLTEGLASLAETAHGLGLEVVLEFHHRSELSRGADVGADVYGVNARDLGTLAIDRATAEETLREAHRRGLRPLLGLSGVEGPSDARRFWAAGVDGILVGTSVARSPDPAAFLTTLRRDSPGGSR